MQENTFTITTWVKPNIYENNVYYRKLWYKWKPSFFKTKITLKENKADEICTNMFLIFSVFFTSWIAASLHLLICYYMSLLISSHRLFHPVWQPLLLLNLICISTSQKTYHSRLLALSNALKNSTFFRTHEVGFHTETALLLVKSCFKIMFNESENVVIK